MSEILTESFCERCGTRYTFESARPKVRLKGVKVLSRGLKNFVLSDDTTMDEAMAAARSETDRESTAHQLDAFHKTFNFCMSCRQYTCPNCWNEVEARCQSCAPLPEPELAAPELAAPAFPGLTTLAGTATVAEPASNGTNGHYPDPQTPDGWPQDQTASAAKASDQTAGLFDRFRPGQNLDDELAAFELDRSTGELAVDAVVDAEASVDWVAQDEVAAPAIAFETAAEFALEAEATPEAQATEFALETEAAVEAVEPATEWVAEATPPELDVETAPLASAGIEPDRAIEPETATPSQADLVEQPTWRIVAPDPETPSVATPGPTDDRAPLRATGPTLPPADPQWPARPEWPTPQASAGLPFLGRPAQPQGGVDSLWAASNRELVATPPAAGRSTSGIQPCISCGLSLSANARFCRRCGTLQGG